MEKWVDEEKKTQTVKIIDSQTIFLRNKAKRISNFINENKKVNDWRNASTEERANLINDYLSNAKINKWIDYFKVETKEQGAVNGIRIEAIKSGFFKKSFFII